ncbi:MAG: hypothetical protein HC817_08425 [Saprospiraceae bacterium]|nr:hypothetical protein [Saprospiraceae bacterium]
MREVAGFIEPPLRIGGCRVPRFSRLLISLSPNAQAYWAAKHNPHF